MAVTTELEQLARHEPGAPPIEPIETGPAAAVTLAAGIGALTLGLLTTLAEASASVASGLKFSDRVGPLSGNTIITVIVFFAAWGALLAVWRRSSPPLRPVLVASVTLIALGLLGTFPTFFQAFA